MYQIVHLTPVYHFSTDAYLGQRVIERSHGYLTLELALKIAGRRWDEDYNRCGDDSFVVVPFGGSPYADRIVEAHARRTRVEDNLPF
jgi:hypothetical protein